MRRKVWGVLLVLCLVMLLIFTVEPAHASSRFAAIALVAFCLWRFARTPRKPYHAAPLPPGYRSSEKT